MKRCQESLFCDNFSGIKSFMKRFILVGSLLALAGCASTDGSSEGMTASEAADSSIQQTGDGLTDAALSPLEDLNLRRESIPDVLERISSPYADPIPATCQGIADEIAKLTVHLGPDHDIPPPEDEEDRAEWAADRSAETALGYVASEASGIIPFRGLVREATGANRHDRAVRRAYAVGLERRSFLKGHGQARGCTWPAAPLPSLDPEDEKIVYRGSDASR